MTYGLVASVAETGSQSGILEDAGAGGSVSLVGGSLPAQAAGCEMVSEESWLKVECWVAYNVHQPKRPEPLEPQRARRGTPF